MATLAELLLTFVSPAFAVASASRAGTFGIRHA